MGPMPQQDSAEPRLQVVEIFASIQGESSFAGLPCSFVRLAGCDLRCRWCDTAWAWSPSAGRSMGIPQVLEELSVAGLKFHKLIQSLV